MLPQDAVAEKITKIKTKGGSRVQVFANTPYSEVELPAREKIRITGLELNLKSIMRLLGKCNPLLIEHEEGCSAVIELDWDSTAIRTSLLKSLTEVSVETMGRQCNSCQGMMKSQDGCWLCANCGNTTD
jgi:hypothetical protein